MFNMTTPLSAFSQGDYNAASFAIAQHEQNIDNVIAYMIDLYDDDVDVLEDTELFRSLIKRYHLTNLSATEEQRIIDALIAARE